MCNKLICNLVGFVVVYLMLASFVGCSGASSDNVNLPAKGGNAGQAGSAGSSTGGSAGTSASGGFGGAVDAGLGGSAGSSGTGGSAGSSTGGSAGQANNDAGDDAPDDAGDAGGDASDDVQSDVSGDGGLVVICPTCDELLTWDTTQYKHSSFGKMSTSNSWDDSYAWQMLKTCTGWGTVGGHEGGTGDTLKIGACNDGVVLVWAYNMFMSVQVSQGWTGKTDTGLGIGASYQVFIQMYPDYTANSMLINGSGYAMLVYANGIAVFNDSKLSELTVN